MPCKFNDPSVWSKEREREFDRLKRWQSKLATAKRNVKEKEPRKGPEYWAFEVQRIQNIINEIRGELGPTLAVDNT